MDGYCISRKGANNSKMYNFSAVEFISALVEFLLCSYISTQYMCVHIQHIVSSVCRLHTLYITCQRKSAVYYLVYLDIWLLLFRNVPTQILLISWTNITSPVWHKSKQDTVVAPSLGPNLNAVSTQGQKIHMPSLCKVCCTANRQILCCLLMTG